MCMKNFFKLITNKIGPAQHKRFQYTDSLPAEQTQETSKNIAFNENGSKGPRIGKKTICSKKKNLRALIVISKNIVRYFQ